MGLCRLAVEMIKRGSGTWQFCSCRTVKRLEARDGDEKGGSKLDTTSGRRDAPSAVLVSWMHAKNYRTGPQWQNSDLGKDHNMLREDEKTVAMLTAWLVCGTAMGDWAAPFIAIRQRHDQSITDRKSRVERHGSMYIAVVA